MKRIPLVLDTVWLDYENKARGIEVCAESMCDNFEIDRDNLPRKIYLCIDKEEHECSMRVDWPIGPFGNDTGNVWTYSKCNRRRRYSPYLMANTRRALQALGYQPGDTFYVSLEVPE